jgi:hypothetical protein
MAETENKEQKERRKPKEINPRWKGYVCILLTSLVAFASTSNVPSSKISAVGYSISVGAVTFTISLLVLILDRFHCADYTKAFNGYFEGCTLMFCVVWWIAGISFMTRAGGLAYRALNIYFFCWLTLASCAYTLNEWSADKDILSMQELTGLSATLKSWYILMGSSFIVMASAANIHPHLKDSDQRAASLAVALSVVSFLTACSFILVHYKFFPSVASGGWLELSTAFVALLFWTIGYVMQWITNVCCYSDALQKTIFLITYSQLRSSRVAVLTQDSGIAASVNGQCAALQGTTSIEDAFIPGSNLYFFSWASLLSSLNIVLRWKAAQALQFAQTKGDRKGEGQESDDGEGSEDEDENDEDAI